MLFIATGGDNNVLNVQHYDCLCDSKLCVVTIGCFTILNHRHCCLNRWDIVEEVILYASFEHGLFRVMNIFRSQILVLTDGEVSNTQQVIDLVRRNVSKARYVLFPVLHRRIISIEIIIIVIIDIFVKTRHNRQRCAVPA